MTNQSSLFRSSDEPGQTAQKTGEFQNATFEKSRIGVPLIRSVYRPPEFSKVKFFCEYCASTKKLLVMTPLYLTMA